jgi:hypothetical protein
LQAAKEITESYIESQKEIIRSFQSVWAPIIQNNITHSGIDGLLREEQPKYIQEQSVILQIMR